MTKVNPIVAVLHKADDAYFNKREIMPDQSYDIIRAALQKLYPNDPYFKLVGAPPPNNGKKVKLAVAMPSMEKKSPQEAIAWMAAHPKSSFMILPKIDGIAGQLTYVNGKLKLATTRGDGVEGTDITEHAKHVVGVWSTIGKEFKSKTIIIRGEFTMHRSVFTKLNLDKYVNTLSLCRSMINSKIPDVKILNKMVFIAYGWHEAGKVIPSKWEQLTHIAANQFINVNNCGPINYKDFHWLQDNMQMRFIPHQKFEPFKHAFHEKPVTKAWVMSTLAFLRKSFDLDMDGLVITLNIPQKKAMVYSYKIKLDAVDQEHGRGTVKLIEYNLSSRRLAKPVGILKTPINFNGTQVKRFTLHNFGQVKKLQIGPGSVVELIKAGEVIPKIQRCIKPKGFEQPKRCPSCNSKFQFNGTDLFCANEQCVGAQLPLMQNFFLKLKVDALGEDTIEAFAKAGYNTVAKIMSMSPKTMAKLERMGEKSAANIINALKKMMSKWQIHEFMYASGVFASDSTALGSTLLEIICKKYSLSDLKAGKIKAYELTALPKIGPDRAELFIERLPEFMVFYESVKAVVKIKFATTEQGALTGKVFVFSNFRNADLEETIKKHGGKIGSSVTAETTVLFATGSSTKTARADKLKSQGFNIMRVSPEKAVAHVENMLIPF